jgi:hypothetical protein
MRVTGGRLRLKVEIDIGQKGETARPQRVFENMFVHVLSSARRRAVDFWGMPEGSTEIVKRGRILSCGESRGGGGRGRVCVCSERQNRGRGAGWISDQRSGKGMRSQHFHIEFTKDQEQRETVWTSIQTSYVLNNMWFLPWPIRGPEISSQACHCEVRSKMKIVRRKWNIAPVFAWHIRVARVRHESLPLWNLPSSIFSST